MLIDNVIISIKAGNGGRGAATFLRDAMTAHGGPNGGNGGNGGDIYFQGSNNLNDLRDFQFKKSIKAENGANGAKNNGFGKNAEHITVIVPLGTKITDLHTGKIVEIVKTDKPVLIARGGVGGYGNFKFKSSTNRSPMNHEPGGIGESKNIELDLRLIAEIGLIGLPNAGKSSLLSVLTNATPTIGAYPFTTLEPNIGMFGKYPIADIPGLIEGASKGIGLGIKFLKHIEKTKILVHCIDITVDNPLQAYKTIRNEFKEFNPLLLDKPEIIFLNKTDLVDKTHIKETVEIFKPLHKQLFAGSVKENESISDFKHLLTDLLTSAS